MIITLRKLFDKEEIEKLLAGLKTIKKLDASKYSGKIKLSEDPIKIQKKLKR